MHELLTQNEISSHIFELRGKEVMLDKDLAEIYGVETKRNEAPRPKGARYLHSSKFNCPS